MAGTRKPRSGFFVALLAAAAVALVAMPCAGPSAAMPEPKAEHPKQPSFVDNQWALRAIGAEIPAFRRGRLAPVTVGLIDSGLDLGHPDLRHRLWRNPASTPAPLSAQVVRRGAPGWDLVADDAKPSDGGGHGTAVGGLIAADSSNDFGIDGVAPNARLMVMRACAPAPAAAIVCSDDSYAAAMQWAIAHGARVIHMSWSQGGGPEIARVVAVNPRVLFVTTAGNGDGVNVDASHYNCQLPYPNLICVAASTRSGAPAPCSGIGPQTVDIAAPGVGVSTTLRLHRYLRTTPCAASFASPHVSGVAALLFGAVPQTNALAVRQAILDGAVPSPGFSGRTATGGIVNAQRSLAILRRAPFSG
jgi:subtilisin family serine protease